MRGQRLFVRPIEPGDEEAIRTFLESYGGGPPPRQGLLGKLVGDIVALLAFEISPDQASVTQLVVSAPLRRKRIGRFMIDELASLCRKLDLSRISTSSCNETEFLRRTGFHQTESEWVRKVSPQ